MRLIVITTPQLFDGEASAITALLEAGLDTLHLRKPQASAAELDGLLRQIPSMYYGRIVTHDHFPLAERFGLKGVHLNSRHPVAPAGYRGSISCSCHSIEELVRRKATCHYLFLSPIFDSISKTGYASAYSPKALEEARDRGIIDEKVVALGGISSERLSQVQKWGFGGAALLGDIWQQPADRFLSHFLHCRQLALI